MKATSTAIPLTKDGGVLKYVEKEGDPAAGHPNVGDSVSVHYVGRFKENDQEFDSSRKHDTPFKFTLGKGEVIKGWDIGVASMNRGEIAELECNPEYAYGANGGPPIIPANSTLIFNIELIEWHGEDISPDRDGSITKSIIVKGERFNCPSEFAPVTAHIVGIHSGRIFYDEELNFILGEGSEFKLPEGVDRAIRRVDKGEKCRIVVKGDRFTYGSQPPTEFNLPPNAELTFTIFLKDFEKVKASWELLDREKLDAAQKLKDRGTEFLHQNKFKLALQKYNAVVTMFEHITQPTDEDLKRDFDEMLIAGLLNSALVHLKMNETANCIKNCDKILEKQPSSIKALYRKAQALEYRKDYEEAIEVYGKVLEYDKDNKAAVQQIAVCKKRVAEILDQERKRYVGLFNKLSAENAKPTAIISDNGSAGASNADSEDE